MKKFVSLYIGCIGLCTAEGMHKGGRTLYEYTALAKAYFNTEGVQVGLLAEIHEDNLLVVDGLNGGSSSLDRTDTPRITRPPITVTSPPQQMPSTGDIVVSSGGQQYRLVSILGRGTDSVVYRGILMVEGTTPIPVPGTSSNGVAIKFQIYDDAARQYSVETDYAILTHTHQFGCLFPKAYFLSETGSVTIGIQNRNIRYLVLELLGGSVLSLKRKFGNKLPMETIASIGIQSVNILEKLHSIGLIHGDVHIENIMFKIENAENIFTLRDGLYYSNQIVFGDYGKSGYYRDPSTGAHLDDESIEFSNERNMLYLSPYELAFGSASRREDIFRLMETLCRLLDDASYSGYFRPLAFNREAILNAKRTVPLVNVLRGIHPIFARLYEYSRSLAFAETPDYERMRNDFNMILQGQGITYSGAVLFPQH